MAVSIFRRDQIILQRRDFLRSAALVGAGLFWPWRVKTANAESSALSNGIPPGIIPGPYKLAADSLPQPGVPRGKTFKFLMAVFDRNGRQAGILPLGQQQVAGICCAGRHFQTLYVSTGKNIYRRKISDRLCRLKLNEFAFHGTIGLRLKGHYVGVPPWLPPVQLPPPEGA
jgi:hypothetical protein